MKVPHKVQEARIQRNIPLLRAMGRRGGRTSQRHRDIRKAIALEYAQRLDTEHYERAKQANEHDVPIDDSGGDQ